MNLSRIQIILDVLEYDLTQFVFIIEDELKHMNAAADCVHYLDPSIQIRLFQGLTGFLDWMKEVKTAPAVLTRAGYGHGNNRTLEQPPHESNLALVIISESLLGSRKKDLIEKFADWFSRKQLFKFGDAVPMLLTAYEQTAEALKLFHIKAIQQVIFKPFDELQLENNLRLNLRHSFTLKTPEVFAIQKNSRCEILQDLNVLWSNELGIFIQTTYPLPIHHVRKYYSPLFNSQHNHSLTGVCHQTWQPNPYKQNWISFVKFIGTDQFQIRQLKQNPASKGASQDPFIKILNDQMKDPSLFRMIHVLLICKNKDLKAHLKKIFAECFANLNLYFLDQAQELIQFVDQKTSAFGGQTPPDFLDAVIFDQDYALALNEEAQSALFKKMQARFNLQTQQQPFPFLIVSASPLDKSTEFKVATIVREILYSPLDSSFVKRKLKLLLPQLILSEDCTIDFTPGPCSIQAADFVQAQALSEFSFVCETHHHIEIGEFREITLWQENEIEMPILAGKCVEKNKISDDPLKFRYQFSFFGLSRKDLQKIRYWTTQNLIRKT